MTKIFPTDFQEKLTMAQDDYILFSDSEDWNKIKKAQYSNLKWEKWDTWARINSASFSGDDIVFGETDWSSVTLANAKTTLTWPQWVEWPTWPTWNWIASITSSKVWKTTTVTITETNSNVDTFQIQDWADGESPNVKEFTLSSTSDLTTAQAAYNWYITGNYPVIKYSSKFYYPNSMGSTNAFWAVPFDKTADSSGTTWLYRDWINMTVSSWTITAMTTTTIFVANSNFLRTGVNYGTPYTPEYNGSPATKKYVDDSITWLWLGTAATCNTWTSSWNVPILDKNWKLNKNTLPWLALTDTFTVSTSSDLTWLSSAEQWDLAIATSENKTYVLATEPYSTASNWKEILSPTGWVTSVNWQTWAVTVTEFTPWGTATTWYVVKKTADWYEWAAESWAVTSVNGNTWAVTVSEFTPSWTATTGYVVTKTANGYEWAAPAGWVDISSQANNILTSWAKIWAWTQANYESLGTYDSSTIYLTI